MAATRRIALYMALLGVVAAMHLGQTEEARQTEEADGLVRDFPVDVPVLTKVSNFDSVVQLVKENNKMGMVIVTKSTCPVCAGLVKDISDSKTSRDLMYKFVVVHAVDSVGYQFKGLEDLYVPRLYFIDHNGKYMNVKGPHSNPKYAHFFWKSDMTEAAMSQALSLGSGSGPPAIEKKAESQAFQMGKSVKDAEAKALTKQVKVVKLATEKLPAPPMGVVTPGPATDIEQAPTAMKSKGHPELTQQDKDSLINSEMTLEMVHTLKDVVQKASSDKKVAMVIVTGDDCPLCDDLTAEMKKNYEVRENMKKLVTVRVHGNDAFAFRGDEDTYVPRVYFINENGNYLDIKGPHKNGHFKHFFWSGKDLGAAMSQVLGQK